MIASFFDNKFSTVPVSVQTTFSELAETLRFGASLERPRADKEMVMSVVPALFDPPKRLKENVRERYCFTGDVDGDTAFILTFDEMVSLLTELKLSFIVHTTTKSTVYQNRYRVILPFDRPLTVQESEAVSNSIHQMFGRVFDTKTFDAGRLSIFPQAWTGAPPNELVWDESDAHHGFAAVTDGAALNVDDTLAAFPPEPKEEKSHSATKAELEAYFSQQQAPIVEWMTDLDRSPIVNPKFVDEFLTSAPGGRFFRFLNRVAGRALTKNIPVDVPTLVAIGAAMDARANVRGRTGVVREAERALRHALGRHVAPPKYSQKEIEAALKARKYNRVRY